jgi:hypothetical protein
MLTPIYTSWVLPPSVREVSRGFRRVTEGVGAESGQEITLAVFVAAVTPSDSPSASHLPQEEGFVASLGEGGVARRSRVTEGVGAESGRGMRLAGFVAAVTPSDSPSASHLPQEAGLGLPPSVREVSRGGAA